MEDIFELWAAQSGACAVCRVTLALVDFDLDHIRPVSRGGESTVDNLQFLCVECHTSKTNLEKRHPRDSTELPAGVERWPTAWHKLKARGGLATWRRFTHSKDAPTILRRLIPRQDKRRSLG